MLKMLIRMDEKKITEEKTYKLESVYQTLDRLFAKYGLLRMEDTSGARVYRDSGNENDFAYFGIVSNILSDQSWFMNNAGCSMRVTAIWMLQSILTKKIF